MKKYNYIRSSSVRTYVQLIATDTDGIIMLLYLHVRNHIRIRERKNRLSYVAT